MNSLVDSYPQAAPSLVESLSSMLPTSSGKWLEHCFWKSFRSFKSLLLPILVDEVVVVSMWDTLLALGHMKQELQLRTFGHQWENMLMLVPCPVRDNYSKWFEPRSISSLYCVIVRVRVVLKRTVVGDWRFDNLSGSHLQSQVNSVCQSMVL